MTDAKHDDLARLRLRWELREPVDACFGRRAPRLLDVGVGNGAATRAWALAHPDRDVVAVELHRPGLVALLRDLDAAGPSNVRVLEADVEAVLAAAEPGDLHDVRVLFPDPWPKRRHEGRRLVDRRFVARVADLLAPGGTLHVATDHGAYADQVRDALDAEARFEARAGAVGGRVDGEGWCSPRPDRPVTAYEARGLAAGRAITDLVAQRR